MKLDNVWCLNSQDDPINRCNVVAVICPPQADHMPIVTILDLSLSCSTKQPSRNFCEADWPVIHEKLEAKLKTRLSAAHIRTKEEIEKMVTTFTNIITEVLDPDIPTTKPSPFSRH
jgi:selenocysteine lyase/cysteine desulfurase